MGLSTCAKPAGTAHVDAGIGARLTWATSDEMVVFVMPAFTVVVVATGKPLMPFSLSARLSPGVRVGRTRPSPCASIH